MNRHAMIGAIRLPVFLVLWTLGVVLLMGRFETADAMLPVGPQCDADHLQPALPPVLVPDLAIEPEVEIRDPAPASLVEVAAEPEKQRPTPMVAITLPAPVIHEPEPARRRQISESPAPAKQPPAPAIVQPVARPEAPTQPVLIKSVSVRADVLDRNKRDAREAMAEGRFADAYRQLRPGVAQARDDVEYLALLAVAALHIEAADEAAVIYLHLAELQPNDARWRTGLDLAMRWHGDPPGGMTG